MLTVHSELQELFKRYRQASRLLPVSASLLKMGRCSIENEAQPVCLIRMQTMANGGWRT